MTSFWANFLGWYISYLRSNLIWYILLGVTGSDLGSNSSRKGSTDSNSSGPDNNNDGPGIRRGSRAPGSGSKKKNEPFDADEDGYAIGEGKKHGKGGIAALKHRADSLTRLNKKDLNDAAEQNGMNKKMILFYFSILLHSTLRGLQMKLKNLSMVPL